MRRQAGPYQCVEKKAPAKSRWWVGSLVLGVVRHSFLRGQPVLANKSPNTPFCDKGMQQMGKKISTHKGKGKKGKQQAKKASTTPNAAGQDPTKCQNGLLGFQLSTLHWLILQTLSGGGPGNGCEEISSPAYYCFSGPSPSSYQHACTPYGLQQPCWALAGVNKNL